MTDKAEGSPELEHALPRAPETLGKTDKPVPPAPPVITPSSLRRKGILRGPEPDRSQLPSVGSGGHHMGRCKPCAFVSQKGCTSGAECKFCHLCEPGEKKKRQKEKRAHFSAIRQSRQLAARNARAVQP
mmetsp:Transcript_9708/g.30130  ORF Transcript_9708/g.30130 Transcript_9708/m.30130 type:complete len:129 (+) Transcript_9708:857-1243(+)